MYYHVEFGGSGSNRVGISRGSQIFQGRWGLPLGMGRDCISKKTVGVLMHYKLAALNKLNYYIKPFCIISFIPCHYECVCVGAGVCVSTTQRKPLIEII